MSPDQLDQFKTEMKEHVSDTIKAVVNGKIDGLRLDFTKYVVEDKAWKVEEEARNAPVVAAFENTNWLFRIVISLLKFAAVLGAGIGAVIYIKDKLIK